ncbi:MAG: nitroreductase family protein [Muribaculaceae bacterium]|nr:nitroreductase family protein [Muribaculaceae bacterium]
MENLHEMLLKRHSIRRYKDTPIDPEAVRTILEAALLAPSSKGCRSWQFVVIENRETMQQLADCRPSGTLPLKNARLAVAVTVSPEVSGAYIEDASIAAVFMQLQAAALGIGSCWVQVRGREAVDGEPSEDIVRDILSIPSNMVVECIVTFGYPDEERRPVDPDKLLWEKVHLGTWRIDDGE